MVDKHTEATCLAFSDIHLGGMKWSVTIRQGVTQSDLDGLLDKMAYLTEIATKKGFRFPGQPKPETEGESSPSPGQPAPEKADAVGGVGVNADDNPVRIGKFKITGTKDQPVVELYSPNEKLKFPVLRPPFSILETVIHRGYPDLDISKLSECGTEGEVNWVVGWVASPKNPKWRDLTDITIPKLGPPAEEYTIGEVQEDYEPPL